MPILEPGTKIRIKQTHGHEPFRGDVGTIDKYVPFSHYYVVLLKSGRQFVHADDVEPTEPQPE